MGMPSGGGARRDMLRLALLGLGALAASEEGSAYVKVINGRCEENHGVLPLGDVGVEWSPALDQAARTWCDEQEWCVGYMRFVGDHPDHCNDWCGRPQFCNKVKLDSDERWVAYIREAPLSAYSKRAEWEGEHLPVEPAPAPPPRQVQCEWPYSGSLWLWFEEPPPEALEEVAVAAGSRDYCQVLHHRRGQPAPWRTSEPEEGLPRLHGVLTESPEVVPYFSADVTAEPWSYSFDSNEYIGFTVNSGSEFGPKKFFLSIFYVSADSTCDGKLPGQWTAYDAHEVLPGHVYVDDGAKETRKKAFNPYHFTVICADQNETGLVSQALVDALGFACHPLVQRDNHKSLHNAFFHLPDAAQPYSRIHPLVLEQYVEDMYTDPSKNEAMYFKQTFMFLLQELFHYRYRQAVPERLEVAACGLCEERRRLQRLAEARRDCPDCASQQGLEHHESVGVLFCVMSRRVGHKLRAAIRETWGGAVASEPTNALRFFVGSVEEGAADKDGSATPQGAPIVDPEFGDVVELPAPESYKAVTLKAFSMLSWAHHAFPNLRFLVRADDDVYLRPSPLLALLNRRAPINYLWGNFDHGSNPVRHKAHPHYNSYEQFPERKHPLFGDIFPPYARGHLWVMSADLLAHVADVWLGERQRHKTLNLSVADRLPHPDDPALGVALNNLVEFDNIGINFDDRDLNHFALNPACNATYLNLHNRTWVVHHVDEETMHCMWAIDAEAGDCADMEGGCNGILPDLCPCSMNVTEEKDNETEPFDYPRSRFND